MSRLQSHQISQLHLYQVLHAVRLSQAPMSRADIAQFTGLSQPAVSTLTRRLLDSGALMEVGARPSPGGRRERELTINPDHVWVLGVKISMSCVTMALTDSAGRVRLTQRVPIQPPLSAEQFVRALAKAAGQVLEAIDAKTHDRLAGVGIAVTGLVDSMAGEVLWTPTLQDAGGRIALARMLSEALGLPVFVENDANLLALSELWFGEAARLSHVAVVTLEHGLGLGLLVNGEIHRGYQGLAGELGHVEIVHGGAPCRCGKQGCLEAYVAKYAVVDQACRAGVLDAVAAPSGEIIESTYAELARRALAGDAQAQALFDRQGQLLGQWIGNLAMLVAPERIIVDAGLSGTVPFEPALREALWRVTSRSGLAPAALTLCHHSEEDWARGAAALVLQRLDQSSGVVEVAARHGRGVDRPHAGASPRG